MGCAAQRLNQAASYTVSSLDVLAIWLEVYGLCLAKVVRLFAESRLNDVGDVMLQHPDQGLVVLRVYSLNVLQYMVWSACN